MEEKYLISSYSKLLNSDILKLQYPMLDRITVNRIIENPNFIGYDMSINIYLNDPRIDKNNMYRMGFNPSDLIKEIKRLSEYIGTELRNVNFKLFGPDKELILNWD
jgi:hypothetical protein